MSEIDNSRSRVVFISEATAGNDAVNAAIADGTKDLIYQDVIGPKTIISPQIVTVEASRLRHSASGVRHSVIKDLANISMNLPIQMREGSGAGEEAPFNAAALKAANFKETIVSSTSATYALSTRQQASMSVYQWRKNAENSNERLYYSRYVRGNLAFQFNYGQEGVMAFTGNGDYNTPTDDALFHSASTGAIALENDGVTAAAARTTGVEAYANLDPVLCINMTLTVGGTTYPVDACDFATNWNVDIKRILTGEGLVKTLLTKPEQGNRVGGSLNLIDGDTAYDDAIAKCESGDDATLVIVLSDGTSKATFTLQIQLGNMVVGESGGLVAHQLPFFAVGDFSDMLADDDLIIVYEAV